MLRVRQLSAQNSMAESYAAADNTGMEPDNYADDWTPTVADGPVDLVVDGELWQVTVQSDGGCRYAWVSGPNPGYGFSSGPIRIAWRKGVTPTTPPPAVPGRTIAYLRKSISDFLAEIDPDTGYLSEE